MSFNYLILTLWVFVVVKKIYVVYILPYSLLQIHKFNNSTKRVKDKNKTNVEAC